MSKKFKCASDSLRPGQLDRMTDKIKDFNPRAETDRLTALCADKSDIVDSLMSEVKRQDGVIEKIRKKLEPIEEVWGKYNTPKKDAIFSEYGGLLTEFWNAIKQAMEA